MLLEHHLAMCPQCGKLFTALDLADARPIAWKIPQHDEAGAECLGTGQTPRNPHSDRRTLWSGQANPHLAPDALSRRDAPVLRLIVSCPKGHTESIELHNTDRSRAEWLASLIDGTSAWYARRPGPDSPIGKCGVAGCGKPVSARVLGEEGEG